MSILSDHVARCARDQDAAILSLESLITIRSEMELRSMNMGSTVTKEDLEKMDGEIEAQREVVAKRCHEFVLADTALEVERKREKEQERDAERQMEREQPRAKERDIGDLER